MWLRRLPVGLGVPLLALVIGLGPQQVAGQTGGLTFGPGSEGGRAVLVASRRQVLEESHAARALAQAERQLAERLQADIDAKKAALAEEEEELARLRQTIPREDFEERADAFRARVQTERRLAQQRSAALQTMFRNARRRLVDALGPILTTLRAERGADVILNADAVLVADPLADVTADVLAAYNARVPPPTLELPEILRAALADDTDAETPDETPDDAAGEGSVPDAPPIGAAPEVPGPAATE